MTAQKGKSMSRAEAAELYRDLKKAMSTVKSKKPGAASKVPKGEPSVGELIAREISKAMKKDDAATTAPPAGARRGGESLAVEPEMSIPLPVAASSPARGRNAAILFVITVAISKVALSALEAAGFATATPAQAVMVSPLTPPTAPRESHEPFSREEVKILTALDARRAELEDRRQKLDERMRELDVRDREFVARLTELRELNNRLGAERDRNQRKRNTQLEQLANVYGSMNPQEAAQLIEQLDVTIALGLIEKMPEKRIGQILATMSPEKALALTRLLSGKVGQ
jgi:flagellar motility protein MotE (MotC chaperone)